MTNTHSLPKISKQPLLPHLHGSSGNYNWKKADYRFVFDGKFPGLVDDVTPKKKVK